MCVSSNLEMLTFERQDEFDQFLVDLTKKTAFIQTWVAPPFFGVDHFHFFVGAYTKIPAKKEGFIWYKTGATINNINYVWEPNQPDFWRNEEWALDFWYSGGVWALNDCPIDHWKMPAFCQDVSYNSKRKGVKPSLK